MASDFLDVQQAPKPPSDSVPSVEPTAESGSLDCDSRRMMPVFGIADDLLVQPPHAESLLLELSESKIFLYERDPDLKTSEGYASVKEELLKKKASPVEKFMVAWVEAPIETAPLTRLCFVLRVKEVRRVLCAYSQAERDNFVSWLTEAVFCNVGAALLHEGQAKEKKEAGTAVELPSQSTKDARWTAFEADLLSGPQKEDVADEKSENIDVEVRQSPGGPEFFVNEEEVDLVRPES